MFSPFSLEARHENRQICLQQSTSFSKIYSKLKENGNRVVHKMLYTKYPKSSSHILIHTVTVTLHFPEENSNYTSSF
jgi:hypothetical protein